MKRLRVDVEAVQGKHRVDARRQRARHVLERLELDNEAHRARLALAAEAKAAAAVAQRSGSAKEDAAALKAAVVAAAAAEQSMEVHSDRIRALASRQARETSAVVYRIGSELRMRLQTAQPLTKTEKRERRRARDAARDAARAAGQAVQAEEEEEGDSDGEAEGGGAAAPRPSKRRAAAPAAPKPRVMAPLPPNVVHFGVPPEYVVLVSCGCCGSHVPRSTVLVCIDCAKELCCRGGISASSTMMHPCIAVYSCKCGFSMCHDCYTGAEARGSSGWRACTVCATWMCSRETNSKLTVCKRCGVDPICRSCRYQHEKLCSQTHEGGEGYEEVEEEEEEEVVVDPRAAVPSHDDDDDDLDQPHDDDDEEDEDDDEEEPEDDDDDSYA